MAAAKPQPRIADLEVCVDSVEDACRAAQAGADRIELNSAIQLGGLTPDDCLVEAVRRQCDLPLVVMVRPRAGDFHYNDSEFELLLAQIARLANQGVDGFVTGVLEPSPDFGGWQVDRCRLEQIRERIGNRGECIFHRAIDLIDNPQAALAELHLAGVDRVLSSGGQPSAWEGRSVLMAWQSQWGEKLQILPGAGIHAGNVRELVESTRCTQVHGTFSRLVEMADNVVYQGSRRAFCPDTFADVLQQLAR